MDNTALDWQKEIYINGFAGKVRHTRFDFVKLEKQARRAMSKKAYAYIAGGAGAESTMAANVNAFLRHSIIPRMLCDVGARDTSITLFGHKLSSPLLLSPIGVLDLVHRDADLAVARAASRLRLPFIFSNQASYSMERCSAVMGDSPRWFQLYWSKSNALVESFIRRAEQCGCSAIVVTLDTTMLGWRTRDLDLAYLPFLEGRGIAQYTSDPVFQEMLNEPETTDMKRTVNVRTIRGLIGMVKRYPGEGFLSKLRSGKPVKAVRKFIATYSNPCTTWKDLAWLRRMTTLPILLKGILHPDDAMLAIDHGIDGIIISNHGGRQVDGAIAAADALPAIAAAVNGRIPLVLDSGIRSGSDVFKAISLGATAVSVGRPYAYGLAVAGEQGVYEVLRNMMSDFELTMGLSGCREVSSINHKCIVSRK